MSNEQQDTSTSEAPVGTPSQNGTQVSNAPAEGNSAAGTAPNGTPGKKYAGKYESPEALEEAYKSLESKIGSKSFTEKIGEKVVGQTGYSPEELQAAGYSDEQIVAVMLGQATGQPQNAPAQTASLNTVDAIKSAVEHSKVDSVKFELELERLYRKNPEAEALDNWIRDFKKHPDYRDLPASQIFEKIQPLMKKGEETAYSKQDEKERANINISTNFVPEVSEYNKAVDTYRKTRDWEDGVALVKQKLFGGK